MHILAIETSGARGGIALADGAEVIDEVLLGEGLRHGRDLIPTAKAACERAGWDRRRIDLVAVSIGPGSFTGIRIAVTMAKVMAHDTGAKIVAVPSMRVMAENAPPDRRRVAAILDAKRGGLFASIFERRGNETASGSLLEEFTEIFGPALVEPEELARHLESPALILGRGIAKGREALKTFDFAPENQWDPRPGVVARLGAELAARGEFVDPMHLAPIYIRPPEAEELWERRKRLSV